MGKRYFSIMASTEPTNDASTEDKRSIPFKDAFSFDDRLAESTKMRTRYDDRIPVMAEPMDIQAPQISQKKFLFPSHFTIGQCIAVIRRRINFKPEQATFVFADGVAPSTSTTLEQVSCLIIYALEHGTAYSEHST